VVEIMTGVTQDERIDLLRGVELFRGVADSGLAAIGERASEATFDTGRSIVRQGEVGTGFYLIVAGRARVVRDGRTLDILGPGQFFGELSVLDGQPRIAMVVAEEPTTCLALASWDFEAILSEQPGVALAILREVARRLRAVSDDHRH
jgi:CRP/FNR family transcriptional regulator, cyclic AMP receptor protein